MRFIRLDILATVLLTAGSFGAVLSCSSDCAPIPCPAPGFDPNTCGCAKPQTGQAGNSAGGTAGGSTNAGAGGMSGGAGGGEAGEAGAPAQGAAASGASCPAPTASACPDKLTVYTAQRVDLVANCYRPEEPVSCDGPLVAEASACWVKLDTEDIYIQSVWPCMPDGWRTCTEMEKDTIANVVTNCK
jgi:hypothetical protein